MSEQSIGEAVKTFQVRRKVLTRSREENLGFMKRLPGLGAKYGMTLETHRSLAAVAIITPYEAATVQASHPRVTTKGMIGTIWGMRDQGKASFRTFQTLELGEAVETTAKDGTKGIGVTIESGVEKLKENREGSRVGLSHLARKNLSLPLLPDDEDFVLTLALLRKGDMSGVGNILDFVEAKKPEEIEVGHVGVNDAWALPEQPN